MKKITRDDIIESLSGLGLSKGETVFLYIDIRTVGQIIGAKSREDYCKTYIDAIFELIGEEGTLVSPTYTTQVARFDIDFVWEETPTVLGTFPEYVRLRPDSLRSMHPLHSVAAIGSKKEYYCTDNGFSDFGYGSPFHRFLETDARILTIGLESGYVVGLTHHLDAACNLPYVYNKLLKWRPIVGGKPTPHPYSAVVRYLHLNYAGYDLSRFVRHMRGLGAIASRRIGGSWAHAASYRRVFEEGARLLRQDPFCLLKEKPEFPYGQIPFDGPTAGKDGISDARAQEKLQQTNWLGFYGDRAHVGGDDDELQ